MKEPKIYQAHDRRGQYTVVWYSDEARKRKTFSDGAQAELFRKKKLFEHLGQNVMLKEITTYEKYVPVPAGRIAELETENAELEAKYARQRDELEALRRHRPVVSEELQSAAGNTESFMSAVQILRPELEKVVGQRPAIVLQQLSWLLSKGFGKELPDGRYYIYNTYPQWQASYFQNWSIPTIKRVFLGLEKGRLIDSKQPEGRTSRRKYYTLSPEGIKLIHSGEAKGSKCAVGRDQFDLKIGSKRSLPTSTKNKNTSKRLIAPEGEQELLGQIEACLGREEMKENGGYWRTLIRGGPFERRALRNTIEDFKNRIRDPAREKIHHRAKWFTDRYHRNRIEIGEAERAKTERKERSATGSPV
jgi:DNA-binding PadR family transcriptional regulator